MESATKFVSHTCDDTCCSEEKLFEKPHMVPGITAATNNARWWHGAPPVCWDPCLAQSAADHTAKLVKKNAGLWHSKPLERGKT